jgi:hypothetical protein
LILSRVLLLVLIFHLWLCRDHNFAQGDLFRAFQLFLMFVVPILNVFIGDLASQLGSNFLSNHLLGDSPNPDLLFEIFKGDALFLRFFLQIVNAGKPHLLPHLVEPLYHIGLTGDAQIFAFLQQKLLVNQVTQKIFLCFIPLRLPV